MPSPGESAAIPTVTVEGLAAALGTDFDTAAGAVELHEDHRDVIINHVANAAMQGSEAVGGRLDRSAVEPALAGLEHADFTVLDEMTGAATAVYALGILVDLGVVDFDTRGAK